MADKPKIRPTLKVWMASQELSARELAKKADISAALVQKASQGKRITRDSALKICTALGITLNDIVDLNY